MKKADSVFAKEGSLVEVPYVKPSFLEVLMSSPGFHDFMAYERMIRKMLCVICNMLSAMYKTLWSGCNMILMMMHVTLMA